MKLWRRAKESREARASEPGEGATALIKEFEDVFEGDLDALANQTLYSRETLLRILPQQALAGNNATGARRLLRLATIALLLLILVTLGMLMMGQDELFNRWGTLTVLVAILIAALVVRAYGMLDDVTPPVGMVNDVWAAGRNMKEGERLGADDLILVRAVAGDFLRNEQDVAEGLYLARDVRAGQPLRFSDVSRWQVVAQAEIQKGQILSADALTLALTPYDRDAFQDVDEVADEFQARVAFGPQEVILKGWLNKVEEVAVSTRYLLPTRPIKRGDFRYELRPVTADLPPRATESYLLNRLPLWPIQSKVVLAEEMFTPFAIPASREIVHRTLADVPATVDVSPGARVTLVVTKNGAEEETATIEFPDVTVVASEVLPERELSCAFIVDKKKWRKVQELGDDVTVAIR